MGAPVGGDLNNFPAVADVYYLKAPADNSGAPEQPFDLFRFGVGGHIEVFWLPTQNKVTDGTANDIGLKSTIAESFYDSDRGRVDMLRMNGVIGLLDTGQQTSSGQSLGKCTTGRWQGGIGFLGPHKETWGSCLPHPGPFLHFLLLLGRLFLFRLWA